MKKDSIIILPKTKHIGIPDDDMPRRIQHVIRNLIKLDKEELEYIEQLNCKKMFEIVELLNHVVETLVETILHT
jgi:hypothetical protein